MTSSVGSVGTTFGSVASSSVATPTAAANSASPTSVSAVIATPIHSPRVTLDPTAGFITQYLNADGTQVVSQTPSAISVAYLRLGLTADGLSKQSPTETKLPTKA